MTAIRTDDGNSRDHWVLQFYLRRWITGPEKKLSAFWLDALGVPYTPPTIRAYSGGHSTYMQDLDGNRIELVQHPLGLKDSQGNKVELVHDSNCLTWARLPGYGPTT